MSQRVQDLYEEKEFEVGVSRPAISYAVRGDTWKHIGATK